MVVKVNGGGVSQMIPPENSGVCVHFLCVYMCVCVHTWWGPDSSREEKKRPKIMFEKSTIWILNIYKHVILIFNTTIYA